MLNVYQGRLVFAYKGYCRPYLLDIYHNIGSF